MQNGGCIGPEAFAKFHDAIDAIHHRGISGISQYGSVPEGARAELSPSPHPSNDLAMRQKISRSSPKIGVLQLLDMEATEARKTVDGGGIDRASKIG